MPLKTIKSYSKKAYNELINCVLLPGQTIESGTFIYPFYGLYYFMVNFSLWPLYVTILIPQLALTLVIYIFMYATFFPVQAFISMIFTGPAGIFTAWMAVLQQSGIVSIFIITYVLMPEVQRVAFDAVLSKECADDVVLLAKLRRVEKVPFIVSCGNFLWKLPSVLILPYSILKALFLLALGYIPFLGPVLVVLIVAPSKGLQAHARYFALKGMSKKEIKKVYKANRGAYMGFGITIGLLESIPFLNLFFMFTNNIGAAIWVVSIQHGYTIVNTNSIESHSITISSDELEEEIRLKADTAYTY